MNTVLAGLLYKCCAVYLDNVAIASPTLEQHLLDLGQVFSRLESAGLSRKLGKCQFCLDELKFLGYGVTPQGILPDMDKPTDHEDNVINRMAIGILEEDVKEPLTVIYSDVALVIEEQVVLCEVPHAFMNLMGLLYIMNVNSLKDLKYTFDMI
ncbi:hypothetical protein MHYP_G00091020 [Metynnis hypsauchen]